MKLTPIQRIEQKDWDRGDCGIACVAMVAHVSYEHALEVYKALRETTNLESLRTFHVDIQKMLRMLGIKSRRVRFKHMRVISSHAIVKVNLRKGNAWHWVVFDAGRGYAVVHDPKPGKSSIITDFRGLKGSGFYISIHP